MKIDSHQHFWQFDPIRDAWITEDMSVIRRDFYPTDLQPLLAQANIGGCVAVQADQSEQETEFLLDLASQHDFIKGVVGWVDLRDSRVKERLEYFSQFDQLKGFRHIVQAETDELFMLRTAFLNGVRALESFGFTYDILIFPHQLGAAKELVARLGNQRFVIDHIAKPYIKQGLINKWKHDIQAIARHENVWCKVSGILTEADWLHWTPEEVYPYLEVVFEAFGTNRVLFGSDWPVCLLATQYQQWIDFLTTYLAHFTKDEKDQFWGENAIGFYGL
ncbi:MAG: amidohydrolase family protein [Spirosomataceae bacterium]